MTSQSRVESLAFLDEGFSSLSRAVSVLTVSKCFTVANFFRSLIFSACMAGLTKLDVATYV